VEHFAINIGRQIGSGGREIGTKLAEKLNTGYYDRELIAIAARESGIGKEFFEKIDEASTFNIIGGILNLGNTNNYQSSNFLYNESLFKIQSDVIKELANRHNCVFVGRCADYVLRNLPRCINIFISANIESRINRIVNYYKMASEDKVMDFIQKNDKKRASYYNYYTNKQWGVASSYHLCINSSVLGIEKTVDFIVEFAKEKLEL
jgi:cytidylate kinase